MVLVSTKRESHARIASRSFSAAIWGRTLTARFDPALPSSSAGRMSVSSGAGRRVRAGVPKDTMLKVSTFQEAAKAYSLNIISIMSNRGVRPIRKTTFYVVLSTDRSPLHPHVRRPLRRKPPRG
ncbi:hypothetical protein BURKHO8Y_400002 [Burkholderia sp. 8Y]|nr:hypothetical protein BURKHO8Y_400002 [Burkholderia sp. 8Y]